MNYNVSATEYMYQDLWGDRGQYDKTHFWQQWAWNVPASLAITLRTLIFFLVYYIFFLIYLDLSHQSHIYGYILYRTQKIFKFFMIICVSSMGVKASSAACTCVILHFMREIILTVKYHSENTNGLGTSFSTFS